MDLKEKQKLMVLFGIVGIAALALYYNILLKPLFLKFLVMNREYQTVRARIRSAEGLIANKEKIKVQHEDLNRRAEILGKRLPGHDEVSSLLGDFSRVAESSGVKILKIKPLEVLDNVPAAKGGTGFYSEFPILIEAMGGYHECGIFINKLEAMERFIRIEDIDIKGRSGDPRHHDIKLRVDTYIGQ